MSSTSCLLARFPITTSVVSMVTSSVSLSWRVDLDSALPSPSTQAQRGPQLQAELQRGVGQGGATLRSQRGHFGFQEKGD